MFPFLCFCPFFLLGFCLIIFLLLFRFFCSFLFVVFFRLSEETKKVQGLWGSKQRLLIVDQFHLGTGCSKTKFLCSDCQSKESQSDQDFFYFLLNGFALTEEQIDQQSNNSSTKRKQKKKKTERTFLSQEKEKEKRAQRKKTGEERKRKREKFF